jgi:UDP-glucose/GDP-mannose dehydrogenase family, NAD binding domain
MAKREFGSENCRLETTRFPSGGFLTLLNLTLSGFGFAKPKFAKFGAFLGSEAPDRSTSAAVIAKKGATRIRYPAHGRKIAVIGLGYVGLPVAVAFGRSGVAVIGYDIDAKRVHELQCGRDHTLEVNPDDLRQCGSPPIQRSSLLRTFSL